MDLACETIAAKVRSMIAEVNAKPVYTIHEMLEGKVLAPTDAIVVGGPAPIMAKQIGKLVEDDKTIVPGDSDVINASGAAMARTTVELTLMADTEERLMSSRRGRRADGYSARLHHGRPDRDRSREAGKDRPHCRCA